MAEQSLKDKTVKGSFWSAADAFLGQGVTFIVSIILARLVTPTEYGLIGICTIFTSVLSGIVDSGFSNSLIRKKNVTEEDYSTMFLTNMGMSLILYLSLFISSPFIAHFFYRPELVDLVRVMGLILFLQGASLVQYTKLTKSIDFKTKTKASFIAAITSGIVGICMAMRGYGVWSLVGQQLSNKFVYSLCLWLFNRWSPNMRFNLNSFQYMWGFGWKLMLSGLLNNVWNQIYQVVVGKCYSPATLGQYTRSRDFASLFSVNFTAIVQRVTFPVLSEVQDDKTRMVEAYRKIIKISMLVTSVILFFLAAIADPLIYCLIGPQWHEAATYLPFICLILFLHPLHAINLNMLQVQGRSDIYLYLEIIKKILSIIPIALGIFVGIYWMLIGSILLGVISFFLNSFFTGKKLGYSSFNQLRDIIPSLCLSIVVALSVYFLKYLPFNNYIILGLQITIGLLVFFVICESTRNEEYTELKKIVLSYINKISK